MMKNFPQKKAYTLFEVIIAVALFSTVSLIALTIFINVTRIQTQLALENAIYEDARFMMERISRVIRNNAIDYEEYFNKAISTGNLYGELFGCYAAQFYNPGTFEFSSGITRNPDELGAFCNTGELYTGQVCTVFRPSVDINTGMYPYYGAPGLPAPPPPTFSTSNAFCPAYLFGACNSSDVSNDNFVDELYLISPDGTRKTYLARKTVNDLGGDEFEYALGMLEKIGKDLNNDGITETWNGCWDGGRVDWIHNAMDGDCARNNNPFLCQDRYDCELGTGVTLEKTLTSGAESNLYKGFIPISPLRTTITRLEFRVTPGEDPRKAFSEPDVVVQPRVTIILEVQPNAQQLEIIGDIDGSLVPSIVLQTTISSRIQTEVKSYIGNATHDLRSSDPSPGLCRLSSEPALSCSADLSCF